MTWPENDMDGCCLFCLLFIHPVETVICSKMLMLILMLM